MELSAVFFWLIVKYMGLLKPGRFFENPLVGHHVLWFIIKDMAYGCDVRWFMIESPVGRHVDWFKIKHMDLLKPVGFSKTH